jgi:hypothetical protein
MGQYLKSHIFDWTNDTVVVKQSAATGIAMLVNMVLVLIPAVLGFVFIDWVEPVFCMAIAMNVLLGGGLMALFWAKGDRLIAEL